MTASLRTLPLLLLLLGIAVPTAHAAPGDAAPTFGDDDDDDDEDEEEAPAEEEPADEEPADEEPATDDSDPLGDGDLLDDEPEEPAPEPSKPAEADEEDEEEDSSDPLDGLELPPRASSSSPSTAPVDDEDEEEEEEEEAKEAPAAGTPATSRRASRPQPEPEPATAEELEAQLDEKRSKKRRLVKVIQNKFFLKYRRLEVTPNIGYVGNDNFIRRLHVGLALAYHINDILGLELSLGYLPNLGQTDYKPLTLRFQREDEVVPDISRVVFTGMFGATVSPIYGKVELGSLRIINYDLYFAAGAGAVHTTDDTAIIKSPCDGLTARERKAEDQRANGCHLVDQWHFASYFGGGLRIVFNKWIGIKLDVRNITHIEQAWRSGDIGLEMKHSLLVSVGASFFLPPEPRKL